MDQTWILLQFMLLPACLTQTAIQKTTGFSRYECEFKVIETLVKQELKRDEQSKQIEQLKEVDKAKTAEIELLQREVEHLRKKAEKTTIAVKVRISKDFTLSVGQRLIYDVIVTNIGNAYHKERGSFRAPVDGNYLFSVTACSKNSAWSVLEIVHDGEPIGRVKSGDADSYYDCNSEVTVARMVVGSTVWVRYLYGISGTQNAVHWNSFTALLVN